MRKENVIFDASVDLENKKERKRKRQKNELLIFGDFC